MDEDTAPSMTNAGRSVYGPRAVGTFMPRLVRLAFRDKASAGGVIIADWPSIIGPALSAVTTPKRLTNGVLTIACTGPIAMELQYLAREVISRINTHLGHEAVRSLRLVQTGVTTRPSASPPTPPPRAVAAAEQAVKTVPAGELHDALVALGSAVLGRSRHSTKRFLKR